MNPYLVRSSGDELYFGKSKTFPSRNGAISRQGVRALLRHEGDIALGILFERQVYLSSIGEIASHDGPVTLKNLPLPHSDGESAQRDSIQRCHDQARGIPIETMDQRGGKAAFSSIYGHDAPQEAVRSAATVGSTNPRGLWPRARVRRCKPHRPGQAWGAFLSQKALPGATHPFSFAQTRGRLSFWPQI